MDHTRNSHTGQSANAASANKINGEEIIRQLEKLLDSYENLDESTLQALERLFGKYSEKRPGFLKGAAAFISDGVSSTIDGMGAIFRGKRNSGEEKNATAAVREKPKQPQASTKSGGVPSSQSDIVQKLVAHEKSLSQECLKAERALADAKTLYEHQQHIYSVYEETVAPFIEPFKRVMENLVYFAACADTESYEAGKTPLGNKRRALRNGMQPGMWGEHLDAAHLGRIDEMFAVESPVTTFTFRTELAAEVTTRVEAYKNRINKANDQRKPYDIENGKLTNRIKQAQMFWEYIDLLRCFLPQLEKIIGISEEEESAQWATEIGQSLLAVVAGHTCRNAKMKFLWVYPEDEVTRRSEKIRVQFIAAELDCPGLYYKLTEEHDGLKRFGCVYPGCTKE